jgi:hypothetical protein
MMRKISIQALGLISAIAAVGCSNALEQPVPAAQTAPPDPIMTKADQFRPPSAAGVKIDPPVAGGTKWVELVTSRAFSARPDPYALHPRERSFEVAQTGERIFSETGGWRDYFVPAVETVVVPEIEPQPYRRLAGVIVGESVLALIDMGDGQLQLIRPGQEIQGWRVASIDSDKAILVRGGNKLPHQVQVRLESPPFGGGSSGGANPGGSGGSGGSDNSGGGKDMPGLGKSGGG